MLIRKRKKKEKTKKNDKDAFKPIARYFNLQNQSIHNVTIYGLFVQQGNIKRRKTLNKTYFSS